MSSSQATPSKPTITEAAKNMVTPARQAECEREGDRAGLTYALVTGVALYGAHFMAQKRFPNYKTYPDMAKYLGVAAGTFGGWHFGRKYYIDRCLGKR